MAQEGSAPSPLVDRVGQTGFLQLEAESFKDLTPQQRGPGLLAYDGGHRRKSHCLRAEFLLRA